MSIQEGQVDIGMVNSTVRAVDGEQLLSPQILQRIVAAVLEAMQQHEAHQRRARAERRVTAGVHAEMEGEEA